MYMRVWRTGVRADRGQDYEQFARDVSLPMFQAHPGCLGVIMAGDGEQRSVVTFWETTDAIDALAASALYCETVQRILALGALTGDQSTDVSEVHLAWLAHGIRT